MKDIMVFYIYYSGFLTKEGSLNNLRVPKIVNTKISWKRSGLSPTPSRFHIFLRTISVYLLIVLKNEKKEEEKTHTHCSAKHKIFHLFC